MNGREEYITTEITQRVGGRMAKKKREAQRKEGGSCVTKRGRGFPCSSYGSLLLGTLGRPILCVFHSQNKPSPYQSQTFGSTIYKFIVMGSVRKPRPYNWRCLWGSCLCDDECESLLGWGQTPQGRRWWPICWAIRGELSGGSQLNGRLAPCARPSSPPGARRLASLVAGPLWTPMEEGGGHAKHFQGAPWWDQFWKIGIGAF